VSSTDPTTRPDAALTDAQRQRLAQGEHEAVAQECLANEQPALAGWVLEQIWDFGAAYNAYRVAGRVVDALRCSLSADRPELLDAAVEQLASAPATVQDEGLALLRSRRRHMEVERVLAARKADPVARAQALTLAGDTAGAARLLSESGLAREALDLILAVGDEPTGSLLALTAKLYWDLGDAEGAARFAQARLREGDEPESASLLARALGSLGHDLAAQMVLESSGVRARDDALPGRYRVTGLHAAGLTGAAYVGFDRVTLAEVEIHMLLADQPHAVAPDPQVKAAISKFAGACRAATSIGHPSIRPVLRIEEQAGLVVLPRAEGPSLRAMIRPPGMLGGASRARALIAFLLEGLVAAHGRGLVHGWLLPSSLVTDALGRPILGPFGAHHLAGLAATQTGSLEEIVRMTAPELRGMQAPPTVASDLYAVGVLLGALLLGSLSTSIPETDVPELALARQLTQADPSLRPSGASALAELRRTVADIRELERAIPAGPSVTSRSDEPSGPKLAAGIEVTVAESWDEATLEALCNCVNPWWQPILDRVQRRIVVAPWPQGSRVLGASTPDGEWRRVIPQGALSTDNDGLRQALTSRMSASSWVVTPSGAWMLALDDLLSR